MGRPPLLTLLAASFVSIASAPAQTIDPFYAGSYSFVSLGAPSGVPLNLGPLTLKAGDPNTLLIGGQADGAAGVIDAIGVTRSTVGGRQRITGFVGSATTYATAPYNDGGLTYAPNGSLLFTGYPVNTIGEIKPGSTSPDRTTTLPFGSSVGSIAFAPNGRLKVLSYSLNTWYDVPFALDGSGLYTFGTPTTTISLSGGIEGVVFVPGGSPLFPVASMLVAEYGSGQIVSYETDANFDPIASTRKSFMSGLTGANGAYLDPSTGDFLFATYGGGNQVISVRGFAAVPEPASLAAVGVGLLALRRRRR